MKFLLDVHIATSIARALTGQGHDALRAALAFPTWPDEEILALAVREDRIVITEDSDFSELVFAFRAPPPTAIIYIRCEPEAQRDMADRILNVLLSPGLDRHIVVIKPQSTRYRPLPDKPDDPA